MASRPHESRVQHTAVEVSDLACTDLPLLGRLHRRRARRFQLKLSLGNSTGYTTFSAPSTRPEWAENITLSSQGPTLLTITVIAQRRRPDKTVGIVEIDLESLTRNTTHNIERTLTSHDDSRITEGVLPSFHCRLLIKDHTPSSVGTSLPRAVVPTIALLAHNRMSKYEQNMMTNQDETREVDRNSLSLDLSHLGSSAGSFSRKEVYGPGDDSQAKPSGTTDDPSLHEDDPATGDTMKDLVDGTKSKMDQLDAESPFSEYLIGSGEAVDSAINVANNAMSIWGPVIDKVRVFMDVADTITEIHPYAKAAWSVISVVPKVINSQLENDQSMKKLGKAMDDMFAFYCETEELHNVRSHKGTIERIVQQTMESAFLIRKYAETSEFWSRTMKYAVSDIRIRLEEHASAFDNLMAIFVRYASVYTEENTRLIEAATARIDITTIRTLALVESAKEILEDSAAKQYLNDVQFNFDAQCIPEKRCLPGTRAQVLSEIMNWAHGYPDTETKDCEDHASILLLHGVAGSGKSAIAHEIARRFADVGRLGSSFCFNVSRQATRSPGSLFSSIARGIAEVDKGWRTALLAVLKNLPSSERQTMSMTLQLQNFLQKPSEQLHCVGPIVIVIDALDESGDADAREPLLRNILTLATVLPSSFRLLITTRPEKDIMDTLGNAMPVRQMDVTSVDRNSIIIDVHSFMRKELSSLSDTLTSASADSNWAMQLAERSEGSFQWAATACKFIKGSGKGGQTPDERMAIVLAQEGRMREPLDDIYVRVLDSVCDFGMDDSPARRRFQLALGLVLDIREPLPLGALRELLRGNTQAIQAIQAFILHLGSLFEGAGDGNRPLRPLHTSVRDFFRTEERSKQYYVKPDDTNETLAQAALLTIAMGPQFNICQLESSYTANQDIPDLQEKIKTHISPALSYSHRFWDAHVCECEDTNRIEPAVKGFLDDSVLIWLEVMALLGIQQSGTIPDSTFAEVERFVSMCGRAISKSVPHLYLSTLAFVPRASFIYEQYTKHYSHALRVVNGGDIRWPQCLLRLDTGGQVRGIAVSPDGRTIASAQGTRAQLWDAATGERIGEPLAGHSDRVRAITFSPNGRRLVSGSKDCTIKIWSTATGHPVGQPLQGHTGGVCSVSCSRDGKSIVSGSHDNTVRIWEAGTHRLIHTLEGHTDTVWSVAFSPDGRTVASSSKDQTIRLWDLAMSSPSAITLTGHEGWVNSVAFSPDGKTVASASADRTIRLWDVATHTLVGEPLRHHSNVVNAVTFSEDGTRLISNATDSSIRVWDIAQRRQAGLVLTGHGGWVKLAVFPSYGYGLKVVSGSFGGTIDVWNVTTDEAMNESAVTLSGAVWSVVFSPDGRRLASGMGDGTIQQWDPETGKAIGKPLIGHSNTVYSVVFSADGRKLVSGSHDRTIRQWDPATGNTIGDAFAGHRKPVRSVAISKDGRWIVSRSFDGTVVRWDAATGEQDGTFDVPGAVWAVAFSPDGQTVVAGLRDNTLRLWDAATTEPIGTLAGHTDQVLSVAFSADGAKLVSGSKDHTVRLWSLETKEAIGGPLTGHTQDIWTVAFSPDGTRIVSGSNDRTVRQWSVATQEKIGRPLEHTDVVVFATISPDGNQIVTRTVDGSIRAWKASDTAASPDVHTLPYRDSSPVEDGWVLGPDNGLLFWVAPDYRTALRKPGNEWVIAARTLELDLSRFAHGTSWTDCRN
ncbi:WD40 repeat-like protein [Trametopsis cervina]|nr:WD40 repeat-like protein [Trametopsis cervina]